jgi:hypothetical protein
MQTNQVENIQTESVEQTVQTVQTDDQSEQTDTEQTDVQQTDVEPEPVDTKQTDTKIGTKLFRGALKRWQTDYQDVHQLWAGSCSGQVLAAALLAELERQHIASAKNLSLVPIVRALTQMGDEAVNYCTLAKRWVDCEHPMATVKQRVFVDKNTFNPHVDAGFNEQKTPICEASLWTILKLFVAQVRAGVNNCFERRYHGLPLAMQVKKETSPTGKGKAKGRGKEREQPLVAPIEEATWNGMASLNLIQLLEGLMENYNWMLYTSPDMSEAYKESGVLRRQFFAQRPAGQNATGQNTVGQRPVGQRPVGSSVQRGTESSRVKVQG